MFPFNQSELTAALRRYLGESDVDVVSYTVERIAARPARGAIRGLGVDLIRADHHEHYSYILKEPHELAHREIGLYRALTSQLPFTIPQLVGADVANNWLLLEPYPTEVPAEAWTADHYRGAIINLARLHDRFWGLSEDLSVYPWLGHPLTRDFEACTMASARAMETIIARGSPALIAESLHITTHIAHALSHADEIAQTLRNLPPTLLHGDYWPGNISIDEDGDQFIYDWQAVSLGPGILDLAAFIGNSLVWFSPLPIDTQEMIHLYRQHLAAAGRAVWSDDEWQRLWNFAVLWRFLQEWLIALSTPMTESQLDCANRVWVEPMIAAMPYCIRDPLPDHAIKQINEITKADD
jgi:hypothetical protein